MHLSLKKEKSYTHCVSMSIICYFKLIYVLQNLVPKYIAVKLQKSESTKCGILVFFSYSFIKNGQNPIFKENRNFCWLCGSIWWNPNLEFGLNTPSHLNKCVNTLNIVLKLQFLHTFKSTQIFIAWNSATVHLHVKTNSYFIYPMVVWK